MLRERVNVLPPTNEVGEAMNVILAAWGQVFGAAADSEDDADTALRAAFDMHANTVAEAEMQLAHGVSGDLAHREGLEYHAGATDTPEENHQDGS
jgi:hypothetical protein